MASRIPSPNSLPFGTSVTDLKLADATIGYCTNVHAGVDLASICRNLDEFAVPARDASGSDELGVGLWIPAEAASELVADAEPFKAFLAERRLRPFTMNGFPYDNFHQPIVKHKVYRPTWCERPRLDYTKQLADILSVLLPESESLGSISTLPIGWPSESDTPQLLDQAGANLRELAEHLQGIESRTGRRIVVAIEPEPGCILDTTDDVIEWFEKQLPEPLHRRYLTVCHDICHSAVMMEPQSVVLAKLAAAGVSVGKVQVSNAVVADWKAMTAEGRRHAINQLSQFAEDRYLHQTGRLSETGEFSLAEDLPELLKEVGHLKEVGNTENLVAGDQRWVVHFHVPIFLERFEALATSQADVLECLRYLGSSDSKVGFSGHLEIETYAWTVLPESMRQRGLSEDIASEVRWLRDAI